MGELPGIVINGASGRMGRMLARVVGESTKARLIGALERPGHDWIGQDIGHATIRWSWWRKPMRSLISPRPRRASRWRR